MDFTHLLTRIQKRFSGIYHSININDCMLCNSHAGSSKFGVLCQVCYQDLNRYPLGYDVIKHNPKLASQIQHKFLDGFACLATFQWPYDLLIKQLKYGNKLNCARVLGELLAEHIQQTDWSIMDYLCPLPLHKDKLSRRGFNQSELLCRFVKNDLDLTMYKGLKRIKNTKTQTELNKKQRLANVKNAFDCSDDLRSKRILLIDDVLTTGATLEQAARVLKLCGAQQVFAATVAIKPLS